MSETLSYQPEVQTETAPDNLTPEEQESLAVGEKMQAAAAFENLTTPPPEQ